MIERSEGSSDRQQPLQFALRSRYFKVRMDIFERVAGALARQGGAFSRRQVLQPGASEQEILDAEKRLGRRLPDDLRAAYARHNGSIPMSGVEWPLLPYILLPYYNWLSLASVCEKWEVQRDCERLAHKSLGPPPELKEGDAFRDSLWTSPGWIPISDGGADYIACDTSPGPAGTAGQLVRADPAGETFLLAKSFDQYIARFVDAVESGAMVSPEGGLWTDPRTGQTVMNLDQIGF